jgi:cell division protein ZapB
MNHLEASAHDMVRLERCVDALLERLQALRQENQSLLARQQALISERANLIARNDEARTRVESMIGRLKALEVA